MIRSNLLSKRRATFRVIALVAGLSFGLVLAQPFGASENYTLPVEELPFSGVITLDEYDWLDPRVSRLGVVEIDLAEGTLRRVSDGKYPWRHASGDVIYAQACGSAMSRIVRVDDTGLPVQITPCSSEIENPGASPTDFEFSRLSPDGTKVAVEAQAYVDFEYEYQTLVFDTTDQTLLASFDDLTEPEWLPDGRLILSGEGLYVTDENLENLSSLDGDRLVGRTRNPAVDPSGTRIAFEFNQQIWHINVDGSDLRELIYGDAQLRYPAWSPDGSTIAYLAVPQNDYYYPGLFFTNIETGESEAVELSPILSSGETVNGPLSWR